MLQHRAEAKSRSWWSAKGEKVEKEAGKWRWIYIDEVELRVKAAEGSYPNERAIPHEEIRSDTEYKYQNLTGTAQFVLYLRNPYWLGVAGQWRAVDRRRTDSSSRLVGLESPPLSQSLESSSEDAKGIFHSAEKYMYVPKNSPIRFSIPKLERAMDGYDKLAAFMGDHHEMLILRRFSMLNAKNLLYLQAELVNLEAELKDIVTSDRNSRDAEK
ncbi:MAG: hypothetical protein M1813_003740 [Trichoglossum hirsutum]|nr:MAG: hypothetical protein M1813_003740 [Trichoglossum hirsutum]